jgi:NCAIR mutase (PurE)-related protein
MAWYAATRIVAGVGDLLQMIENDHIGRILGGRVIEKSDDAICGMHRACGDEERIFLG